MEGGYRDLAREVFMNVCYGNVSVASSGYLLLSLDRCAKLAERLRAALTCIIRRGG